jgi:chromate transporter
MVGYVGEVMIERRHWISREEFTEALALCQLVPGATLTQVVCYVGLVLRGPAGSAAAAGCFIFPGAALVLILAALYFRWQALPLVQTLSHGVGTVVVAILAYACLRLAKTSLPTLTYLSIAVLACLAYLWGLNGFVVVIAAAGAGYLIGRGRRKAAESATGSTSLVSNVRPMAPAVWVGLAGGTAVALLARSPWGRVSCR